VCVCVCVYCVRACGCVCARARVCMGGGVCPSFLCLYLGSIKSVTHISASDCLLCVCYSDIVLEIHVACCFPHRLLVNVSLQFPEVPVQCTSVSNSAGCLL
jgi:hypothetical protein